MSQDVVVQLLNNPVVQLVRQGSDTRIVGGGQGPSGRPALYAGRTYYVSTSGSDLNDGLSTLSPFQTVQKAIDVAGSLDLLIYDVTIQLANGTYNLGNLGLNAKACVGAGSIIIVGDEITPANVVLRVTGVAASGASVLQANNCPTIYKVRGCRIESTATGSVFGLLAAGASKIEFQNIDIGAGFLQAIRAADNGLMQATGNYSISGDSSTHWACVGGGIIRVQGRTITFVGTRTQTFVSAILGSMVFGNSNVFAGTAGSALGLRYNVDTNAAVSTAGGGANYFPGNSAGVTQNGGQYI